MVVIGSSVPLALPCSCRTRASDMGAFMNTRSILTALAVAFATLFAGEATALSNRTFVSGKGLDTNPCTLTEPCRSFAQALTQTNAKGEIAVLDTAGYGPVTINKSISIVNQDGAEAGITGAATGPGILIDAGASDIVNLRGLILTGGGSSGGVNNGIESRKVGVLTISNCTIRGFGRHGIALFQETARAIVSDTLVQNNGLLTNGSGIVHAPAISSLLVAERVQVSSHHFDSTAGIIVTANNTPDTETLEAVISNSTIFDNARGISAEGFSQRAVPRVTVTDTKIVGNASRGIFVQTAGVFLANSTLSGNAQGFFISQTSQSRLNTFGNNNIVDATNTGTLTTVAQR